MSSARQFRWLTVTLIASLFGPVLALAAEATADRAKEKVTCSSCAEWNAPQKPFRIFGNTYYVGVHGLTSILITSKTGHVLIDGALQESTAQIAANIAALGFRLQDVKWILNSHVHFDHAGGIAELQKLSGASVAALPWSAKVLEQGDPAPDDPQFGGLPRIEPVKAVKVLKDGETVRAGELSLTVHATPGHTPGSATWTWKSCEASRCLNMVYADSLAPVAAQHFKFSKNDTYPTVVADFEKSAATLESLPCDVLFTPHPDSVKLFDKIAQREAGQAGALIDSSSCRVFAQFVRQRFAKRLAEERSAQ